MANTIEFNTVEIKKSGGVATVRFYMCTYKTKPEKAEWHYRDVDPEKHPPSATLSKKKKKKKKAIKIKISDIPDDVIYEVALQKALEEADSELVDGTGKRGRK